MLILPASAANNLTFGTSWQTFLLLMPEAPLPFHSPVQASRRSAEETATRADADREVMRGFMSGDDAGFSTFYRRFAPGLFSMVYAILRDQRESEDVVQESFVQMWKKTATYDSTRSSLFTWAVMIARTRAIDRLRARQRRGKTVDAFAIESAADSPLSGESADRGAMQSDEAARVRSALVALPALQREALEMAFFSGMTHVEICSKLSAPLGTVKARIRRGLIALRDVLRHSK